MTNDSADHAAAARHLRSLTDLATPFAVRVAASLRVAELIEAGTCELGALAAASGSCEDALGRLLRFLVRRGVFTEPSPGVFGLTETGRLLADPNPVGPRVWLDLTGAAARSDLAYPGMLHSVRTGEAGYASVHGRTFWEDLDAVPAYQQFFDEVMMAGHQQVGPQVAALYDWQRVKVVVDVGGGTGALLQEVLRAHPHVRATLVDRPQPAVATARRLAATDVADRVDIVTGDFFGELPSGGDVYLISRALSDWGDREALTILRNCRAAAAPRGLILIVEVLPTDPFVPHESAFDLRMLTLVGGKERSSAEFASLANDAGLEVTRILHGKDGLMLIECAGSGGQ